MLVPATADDLRIGGKIVVNNDGDNTQVKNYLHCYEFFSSLYLSQKML